MACATGAAQVRDTAEGPPRTEGVVSLQGRREATQGCFMFPHCGLQGKDSLRTLLNEDHDEQQHGNLGQYGAGPAFEQLGEHAQAQGRIDRAGQLADAAQHHDQETVNDVVLAQIRPTLPIWLKAQPASPAMPEPSANA